VLKTGLNFREFIFGEFPKNSGEFILWYSLKLFASLCCGRARVTTDGLGTHGNLFGKQRWQPINRGSEYCKIGLAFYRRPQIVPT